MFAPPPPADDDDKGAVVAAPPLKRRRGLSDGAIVSIAIVCVAGSALPISLLVASPPRGGGKGGEAVGDLEGAG